MMFDYVKRGAFRRTGGKSERPLEGAVAFDRRIGMAEWQMGLLGVVVG